MQRMLGVAVSDAALLRTFAEAHSKPLEIATPAGPHEGVWGIGFHSHGEMLTKKGPMNRGASMLKHLRDVRARHVVLVSDTDAPSRHLDDRVPLRYRDWLFAMTGEATLGADFARAVQAELPTYAFSQKRQPSPEEAALMVFMDALERVNARDTRDLTTRAIQRAVAVAAAKIRTLSPDAAALFMLHVPGTLITLGIGRPVWVARFRGAGEVVRHPHPAHARPARSEHLKAVLIGDRTSDGVPWEPLGEGLAAELDAGCDVLPFPA